MRKNLDTSCEQNIKIFLSNLNFSFVENIDDIYDQKLPYYFIYGLNFEYDKKNLELYFDEDFSFFSFIVLDNKIYKINKKNNLNLKSIFSKECLN